MKIAIFTDTYLPQLNGVSVFLSTLEKVLKKKKHKVVIFAPRIKGYRDISEGTVRLPSLKVISSEPEGLVPALVPSLAYKKMLGMDAEIVHAHGNGPFSLLGLQVARIRDVPYVLTFHNDHTKYTHYLMGGKIIKPGAVAKVMKVFANLCDGVLTPSHKMEEELRKYGVKKPITVIPNFIDWEMYQVKEKNYLRNLLGIDKKSKILLFVGRVTKEKNIDLLLEIFVKVLSQRDDVHLVIVGKGPEMQRFQGVAKTKDKVHFAGQIGWNDMPEVYADSDLFVTASVSEVHPVSALEAAASGLPMVVAKDSAYQDIVLDGVNGYVSELDVAEFSQKILKILDDNKLAGKFAKQSRQISYDNFRTEVIVGRLLEYYKKIITEHDRRRSRNISAAVNIDDPVELVWEKLTDVECYPRIIKFVKEVKLHGPFRVGTYWDDTTTMLFFPQKVRHKILKVVKNSEVVYLAMLPFGGRINQRFVLKRLSGGGTQIVFEASINLGNRVMNLLFGKLIEARNKEMVDKTMDAVSRGMHRQESKQIN